LDLDAIWGGEWDRSNCLKGVSGKVIVDEKEIKDSWKEHGKADE